MIELVNFNNKYAYRKVNNIDDYSYIDDDFSFDNSEIITPLFDEIIEVVDDIPFPYNHFMARIDNQWAIFYIDKKYNLKQITQWFDWIKLYEYSDKLNYFIGRKDNKESLFLNKKGTTHQISQWFDKIYPQIICIRKNYFIVEKNGKQSIYENMCDHVAQVSDWYEVIDKIGDVYYIAGRKNKLSICKIDNGLISKTKETFDEIKADELLEGRSNFFIAKKDGKFGIYELEGGSIDNLKEIVTGFEYIKPYGIVNKESNYFIAKKDGKESIYQYKEGDVIKITDEFDYIKGKGLTSGQSSYFIAVKNGKWNIYQYKDGNIEKITDDFDWINEYGLVEGDSDYFIAKDGNKYSIYEYKDDSIKKITDNFDWVISKGLVRGESNYFIGEKNNKYIIFKYINGVIKKLLGDISRDENQHLLILIAKECKYVIIKDNGKESIFICGDDEWKQITPWFDAIESFNYNRDNVLEFDAKIGNKLHFYIYKDGNLEEITKKNKLKKLLYKFLLPTLRSVKCTMSEYNILNMLYRFITGK